MGRFVVAAGISFSPFGPSFPDQIRENRDKDDEKPVQGRRTDTPDDLFHDPSLAP